MACSQTRHVARFDNVPVLSTVDGEQKRRPPENEIQGYKKRHLKDKAIAADQWYTLAQDRGTWRTMILLPAVSRRRWTAQ